MSFFNYKYISQLSSLGLGLGVLLILFYFFDWSSFFNIVSSVSLKTFLVLFLIALTTIIANGLQIFYTTKKTCDFKIVISDIFLLPAIMHLFGYVLPLRGSYLFSVFFLRMKYEISIIKGGSIGIVSQLIGFSISGVLLVLIAVSFWSESSWFLILFGFILFSSVFFPSAFIYFFKTLSFKNNKLAWAFKTLFSMSKDLKVMLLDFKHLMMLVALNFSTILIHSWWFFSVGNTFNLALTIHGYVLYAILFRLSTFIRLVPGNIGVQEFFAGLISVLLGVGFETGLAIGLFFRMFTFLTCFFVGVPGLIYNFKFLNTISYSGLMKKIKGIE